jgi:NADH-quinone oxidoreductase subunit G
VKTLLATRAAVIPAHRSHPNRDALEDQRTLISRIGEIPIYSTDSLVRRSEPLQKAQTIMEGASDVVRMHPDTASKLGLVADKMVTVKQGTQTATLLLCLDPRVAIDAAWIAGGVASTVGLGDLMGMVEVSLC